MKMRLTLNERGELVNRDGTVVASIVGVTLDIDTAFVGTTGVVVEEREKREDHPLPLQAEFAEGRQASLVADPVDEVWEHYVLALERPKAVLTPKVRRWISDAVQAVGIDRCMAAISGLAVSEHHRQGGYTGIEYALRPKANQTIESRIAMMESKAPQRSGSNGLPTVQELLVTVPSEGREIVRNRMTDVVRMHESPDHAGIARAGEDSLAKLRDFAPHVEPVIGEDGRVHGWRRVHV